MLGLSVMRVIQTTLGQFPPCDPAGDASHADLWKRQTRRDSKRAGNEEKKSERQRTSLIDWRWQKCTRFCIHGEVDVLVYLLLKRKVKKHRL